MRTTRTNCSCRPVDEVARHSWRRTWSGGVWSPPPRKASPLMEGTPRERWAAPLPRHPPFLGACSYSLRDGTLPIRLPNAKLLPSLLRHALAQLPLGTGQRPFSRDQTTHRLTVCSLLLVARIFAATLLFHHSNCRAPGLACTTGQPMHTLQTRLKPPALISVLQHRSARLPIRLRNPSPSGDSVVRRDAKGKGRRVLCPRKT